MQTHYYGCLVHCGDVGGPADKVSLPCKDEEGEKKNRDTLNVKIEG